MINPGFALGIAGLCAALGAALFWPDWGLYPRWRRHRRMTDRVLTEDALKHLFKCALHDESPTVESVAGALQINVDDAAAQLDRLAQAGLAEMSGRVWRLTPEGRNAALHIVRAHRLWERHLAENTGYGETEWHQRAELAEHELLPTDAEELAARLGYPTHDPHGDPIPDAEGHFVAHGGQPLSAWPLNRSGRIVHVEDEPEAVYAQLLAEGLYPGMEITMLETSPQRVRFWANGDEHVLAPIVAANISVVPVVPNGGPPAPSGPLLASLSVGEKGKVTQLSPRCRGAERRRMMDLGILPGAVIGAELVSPSGGTTAYRIRDALIALRPEQANLVHVQPLKEAQ